jgi:hypothetical protein
MKKSTLTEDKAEQTPTGGVLVGKRKGQTIIHNKGTLSGYLVGKTHAEGGIKAVNKSTGQALEMQGGEVVITAPAVSDNTKREFEGKMMTNRQILSTINEKGGGVAFAKDGMEIPKSIKRTGASYKYGGKTMTDHEIYKKITGGHLAEGMTLSKIAKKHNVSVKDLQKQVDMGMKAESEHTSSKREQMKIVKDHLFENPKYYSLLKRAGLEDGGLTLNGFDVDYFETKRGIYANLEIPSQNPTFEDDIQIKGFGKNEKEAFKDLKKELEIYLKKSNYKHGGRVHRGSLVRDAKSGNTSARDLNNYNDMLDVEADGKVGGDTGLFANGGTVKPYDANMDGDSADMMFAKGGATDVVVDNWSDIPDEFKNIRLPKQIDWNANPSDDGLNEIVKPFLSKEPLRPAMEGINFDDNGITVTNAHILLTIPTVDHEFQGIYKKEKLSSKSLQEVFPDGVIKIDAKFPNYEPIIPKQSEIKKVFYVDVLKLLTYFKVAKNYSDNTQIVFKIDGSEMSVAPDLMINFLTSLIKLGGNQFMYVSFQTDKRGLIFSYYSTFSLGKDVIGLIMPYVFDKGETYGAVNEEKKAELNVYFDFDYNVIRNADDSIVDLTPKPTKTRAKRTPKTTQSQTSTQKSKTLTKEELEQSKIWIGSDLGLRDMVMEKLNKIGFEFDKGYGDKDLSTKKGINIRIYTNDFVVYGDELKTYFDKMEVKEIFPSDLGIDSTDTLDETITDEDVEIKKLILAFIKEGSWSLEKEIKTKEGDSFFKDFYKNEPPTIYRLTAIRGQGLYPTDLKTLNFLDKIGLYDDYEEPVKETSSEKFTSGEIDAFSQIDAIVDKYKIDFIDVTSWGFEDRITDFDIVDTLTGDVFYLRQYNLSLGVQEEDVDIEKSRALIRKYKEFKKLTPTKDVEKQEEKVEVWKLYPVSEDGQHTSDFGLYGAKQLLEYLVDSYSQFPQRDFFEFKIVDQNGKTYDNVDFFKGLDNLTDLVAFINSGKQFTDKYDWLEFNLYDAPKEVAQKEELKPSKTEKPKRNFELERKYLSQRISDLAKELDLKKPILSNEEVAFYQREINSFILKLRKLNDAEMSLKPIEERVRGVYELKISSFDNQYTETDMTSINALKSQLTEKEYFNVRTPEFKSFFGDWETAYLNDSYAGVSKVINPVTKEPQPVFHGTNVLFVNWKTYDSNNAHYFAVKREFSEFFATTWEERTDKAGVDSEILKKLNPNRGNFLLRCFIDVKNPIDFSRFGVEKYPIREFLTFLRVNYNIGDFDFWTNITSHSGFTQDTEVYAWQIIRLWQSFTKYVKVFTTYDGYIFYEYIPTKPYGGLENASLSYCAFDSNQIKFTDAYEFNALSNDSRFDLGGIL